jgi:hypothetical protein
MLNVLGAPPVPQVSMTTAEASLQRTGVTWRRMTRAAPTSSSTATPRDWMSARIPAICASSKAPTSMASNTASAWDSESDVPASNVASAACGCMVVTIADAGRFL